MSLLACKIVMPVQSRIEETTASFFLFLATQAGYGASGGQCIIQACLGFHVDAGKANLHLAMKGNG